MHIIPNGLEKYRSFTINNQLIFIYSFQIVSDGLIKNLIKNDFKYLGQEFGNNILDLVKQKGFSPINI